MSKLTPIECNQLRANEIMNKLESLGWKYRGGYGKYCQHGSDIWGHSYEGPNGEYVAFDFTYILAVDMVGGLIHGELPVEAL